MAATKIYPLFIEGLFPASVTVQENNFTAAYNSIHICTDSIEVQLPEPKSKTQIIIKSLGENTITIKPYDTEKIEGIADDFIFQSTNESSTLVSNGVDWFII
jgi:lipopolysaccharide export system protein LptA